MTTINVRDSVAGHYTVCHSLTTRQIARLRRIAEARAALHRPE